MTLRDLELREIKAGSTGKVSKSRAVWFYDQRNIDFNNYYGCAYPLYLLTHPTS